MSEYVNAFRISLEYDIFSRLSTNPITISAVFGPPYSSYSALTRIGKFKDFLKVPSSSNNAT